jgi:hypothetical protein
MAECFKINTTTQKTYFSNIFFIITNHIERIEKVWIWQFLIIMFCLLNKSLIPKLHVVTSLIFRSLFQEIFIEKDKRLFFLQKEYTKLISLIIKSYK